MARMRLEALEIRHPLPRKPLRRDSPELLEVCLEHWDTTGIVVGMEQREVTTGETSIEVALKKKKRRLSKAKKKGSEFAQLRRGGGRAAGSLGGAETVTLSATRARTTQRWISERRED